MTAKAHWLQLQKPLQLISLLCWSVDDCLFNSVVLSANCNSCSHGVIAIIRVKIIIDKTKNLIKIKINKMQGILRYKLVIKQQVPMHVNDLQNSSKFAQ
ncbi:MAG TPA: hypothetical protein DIT07_01545 [Sphingobacteriaceae bacterium]|nr:hypothetical protein [Sphingobacteriaceae bacterium]